MMGPVGGGGGGQVSVYTGHGLEHRSPQVSGWLVQRQLFQSVVGISATLSLSCASTVPLAARSSCSVKVSTASVSTSSFIFRVMAASAQAQVSQGCVRQ